MLWILDVRDLKGTLLKEKSWKVFRPPHEIIIWIVYFLPSDTENIFQSKKGEKKTPFLPSNVTMIYEPRFRHRIAQHIKLIFSFTIPFTKLHRYLENKPDVSSLETSADIRRTVDFQSKSSLETYRRYEQKKSRTYYERATFSPRRDV